jgi:hypothetical protein
MTFETIMQAFTTELLERLRPMVVQMVRNELDNANGDPALATIAENINLANLARHIDLEDLAEELTTSQLNEIADEINLKDGLTRAIIGGLDYNELACSIDMHDLTGNIDLTDLASNIDMDDLARNIDLTELCEKVDYAEFANYIDVTDIAVKLDLNELADSLAFSPDTLAAKIDLTAHIQDYFNRNSFKVVQMMAPAAAPVPAPAEVEHVTI